MIGGGDSLPIRSRGLIGDTASAALVAADGTVDWWCPERFDRPPLLRRLLDPAGAAVQIRPAGWTIGRAGRQEYEPSSLVLRTVLPGPGGDLETTDLMPRINGRPDGRIVRLVTVTRGEVDVEVAVQPNTERDVSAWSSGIAFDGTTVHTGLDMTTDRTGRTRMVAGDRLVVVIGGDPLRLDDALRLVERTIDGWRRHAAAVAYDGPYRAEVEQSVIVLKALTHWQTGGMVAAPTTSLPERIGGERNWDYRYTWIRDASLATDAVYDIGLTEEGDGFAGWLKTVVAGAEYPLRPVYALDGSAVPDEDDLGWAGFLRSQPVRTGNRAADQLQLDFYADLIGTIHPEQLSRPTPTLDLWPAFTKLADWLTDTWSEPDSGIWEIRSEPRRLVSSRLSVWAALDRMVRLGRVHAPLDLAAIGWRQTANEILEWLETGDRLRGEDSLDASLLRVAWRGPWPNTDERVVGLVDRIIEQLGHGPFVYRYPVTTDDGLPPGEGAFVPCSFWAVQALAAMGRWDEAHHRMEPLCAFGRPLGLFPEEADPTSGDYLGNLPQAFSHLSMINAARFLASGPA